MEYRKLLLLMAMLLITMLTSPATAKRHGHHKHHSSQEMVADDPYVGVNNGPGRGHGHRGFQGDVTIPGFPIKGPPSPPFVLPQHRGPPHIPRGHHMGGPPMHLPRDNEQLVPGVAAPYPIIRQNSNNAPIYANNPFLPRNPQIQGNFPNGPIQVQQPPQSPLPVGPNQYEDLQKLPAIEPVTNELPSNERYTRTTAKPTVNPRQFDLLYGSNLYEENKTKTSQQQSSQTEAKNANLEPDSFDERILIDSAPHCQEGYTLVGNKCRLKV